MTGWGWPRKAVTSRLAVTVAMTAAEAASTPTAVPVDGAPGWAGCISERNIAGVRNDAGGGTAACWTSATPRT